jgi:DNA-directed RNA polymerase subunit omega
MAQVPFEDLMEHVDSKYRLVVVASKRAKQLNRGAVSLVQVRNVKPTYQALEEIAAGKLTYEMESLAGEMAREQAEAKQTWYRSLSAEEVAPEEVVAETEEATDEEEEVPAEAPVAGAANEDLLIGEFEEESLEGLGELEAVDQDEAEE